MAKQPLTEELKRMQKLAGIKINENEERHLLPSTPEYWYKVFTKINNDVKGTEEYHPLSDFEYYADQIWNMTEEGDIPEDECVNLAKGVAKIAKEKGDIEEGAPEDAAFKAAAIKKAQSDLDTAQKMPATEGVDELDEMARLATVIKIGDPALAAEWKKKFEGKWKADLIDFVEKAGDEGISQPALALALGKVDNTGHPVQQAINPTIRELVAAGVIKLGETPIAKSKLPKEPKPEKVKPSKVEPEKIEEPETGEEGPEPEDTYYKPDTEFDAGDEDAIAAKAAEKAAKAAKTTKAKEAAKLSPEDEEKYQKIKKGIENKIIKLEKMPKSKVFDSDDFKVLKQLVHRDDVKKLLKAKGVTVGALTKGLIANK